MTGTPPKAALQRLDQSLAEAEAAFAMALPPVPHMRPGADRIAEGRSLIDAAFAARLDYRQVQAGARRVTRQATARARQAEAGHRRLRRRLFWQLLWARYQDIFWTLLALAFVAGLGWAGWLWRAEIMAFIVPPAPAPPPATAPALPPVLAPAVPQTPAQGAGGMP